MEKRASTKAFESSNRYKKTVAMLKSPEEMQAIQSTPIKLDSEMISVLGWSINHAKTLKHSIFLGIKEFLNRGNDSRKRKKRLVDRIEKHLDMRNIVESQVTLITLLKRALTKPQRHLLGYQRDRLMTLADSEHSDDFSEFDFEGKRKPRRVKMVLKGLKNFEPQTELDFKLLLGVLERDKKGKKEKRDKRVEKQLDASHLVKHYLSKIPLNTNTTDASQFEQSVEK